MKKEKNRFLEVGQIVGTHGLKGDVRVDPWCDGPDFVCDFKTLYLKDGSKVTVEKARVQKNIAILKLRGTDTIEQADLMRRTVLYIDRNDVQLDEDEFFIADLIGCTVKDIDSGTVYGEITDVLKTGANDVYQIKNESGQEYLIPVIEDVVISTDIENSTVCIRPMKGLFGDED